MGGICGLIRSDWEERAGFLRAFWSGGVLAWFKTPPSPYVRPRPEKAGGMSQEGGIGDGGDSGTWAISSAAPDPSRATL